jgi:predicted dehydrogenase
MGSGCAAHGVVGDPLFLLTYPEVEIMKQIDRRSFLGSASAAGVAAAAAAGVLSTNFARQAKGSSPAERVVLAIVGVHGRGMAHVAGFAARDDCEVAYICDVDSQYYPAAVGQVEKVGARAPKTVADMRQVFDDPAVDAVVIATPDHWHALATIWACQAGKDVYVEKPVSNNVWEGRQMVAAARRHQRVVQAGMQNRSAPYNIAAKDYIQSGKLGTIEFVRVYNQKPQPNFDKVDATAPPTLDWNLWNGPAPDQPYNATMHGHWHSFWRYGGGEITNDAIHQMDLARWVLGLEYPKTISSVGRPHAQQGAAETPDTVATLLEFDKLVMTVEQTLYAPYMLKSDQEVRDGDLFPYWEQNGERIEIYGSQAMMILGRHGCGWQVFDRQKNRKPVIIDQMYGRFPDRWHHENFISCVRSRSTPSADIEEGHRSALICHAANISYRIGNKQLQLDSKAERFVNNDDANALLKYEYRAPFTVPELV